MTDKQRLVVLKDAERLMGRVAFALGKGGAIGPMVDLAKAHAQLVQVMADLKK